jgi:hypothetical protein
MSLVGSLVDLGLGDILQIVSLSRKSGLLLIHSDEGEGRIIFCDGLVQAAYLKGEPEDLRGLLVSPGSVCSEEFFRAEQLANERGVPLDQIIPEFTSLSQERLESLVREHVERVVFRIFSWTGGEFSFEVRDQIDARDRGILMPTGINAQFLTIEATRLGDEGRRSGEEPEIPADDPPSPAAIEDPMFSGERESADPPVCDQPSHSDEPEVASATPEPAADSCEPEPDAAVPELHEVVALAAARREAPEREVDPPAAAATVENPRRGARAHGPACLIAIDPDLNTLEWEKAVLAEFFPRVHIFQSSESGVARIRQYLSRGEMPVVLVSADLPGDSMSGRDGVSGFVRRLKLLAPSMPVLIGSYKKSNSNAPIDAADAFVSAPHPRFLVNRHDAAKLQEVAHALRAEIGVWLENSIERRGRSGQPSRAPEAPAGASSKDLKDLRILSERMRDPVMQGEALSLVLDFAAESFSRVAMFMVRDEIAVGMAQRGLPSAGGPNDDEIRALEIPTREVEWFRRVLESDSALRSAPTGDGDRDLALRLGRQLPAEAYVAPILSGGRVVALLYTDNVPGEKPIGDTTILEIALHEAGLALERALLERALSQVINISKR